jgi:hypothetical protein
MKLGRNHGESAHGLLEGQDVRDPFGEQSGGVVDPAEQQEARAGRDDLGPDELLMAPRRLGSGCAAWTNWVSSPSASKVSRQASSGSQPMSSAISATVVPTYAQSAWSAIAVSNLTSGGVHAPRRRRPDGALTRSPGMGTYLDP